MMTILHLTPMLSILHHKNGNGFANKERESSAPSHGYPHCMSFWLGAGYRKFVSSVIRKEFPALSSLLVFRYDCPSPDNNA